MNNDRLALKVASRRSRHRRLWRLLAIVVYLTVFQGTHAQKIPDWLKTALDRSDATFESGSYAAILHSDRELEVGETGKLSNTRRFAIRINAQEGRDYAYFRETYDRESGRIRDVKIWIIHPDGRTVTFNQRDCVDAALGSSDVYYEIRTIAFNARDQIHIGSVLAYEVSSEVTTTFNDQLILFQHPVPAYYQRFKLTVPSSWNVTSTAINQEVAHSYREGNRYEWIALRTPAIDFKDEALTPAFGSLAAYIAIKISSQGNGSPYLEHASWNDVAAYIAVLNKSAAKPNEAILEKARELTANATSEFERIGAIARFTQATNYVAIDLDMQRGGGYTAAPAAETLNRGYGDCKDKVTMMQSLLQAIGIDAYLAIVRAGELVEVAPEWPSAQQFDHAIIAIRVSSEIQAPSIIEHPVLGRLLLFDPTHPYVAVGGLTRRLQGAWALICTRDEINDPLIRMPVISPELTGVRRAIQGSLDAAGRLQAEMKERYLGADAWRQRGLRQNLSERDFRDQLRNSIVSQIGAAELGSFTCEDRFATTGDLEISSSFVANAHARLIGNRMMIFKPILVSRSDWTPPSTARRNPIDFWPRGFSESIEIELPEGFQIDEMPPATSLKESFAEYAVSYSVSDRKLTAERTLQFVRQTVPASEYSRVQAFYASLVKAEQAPVVLMRMPN